MKQLVIYKRKKLHENKVKFDKLLLNVANFDGRNAGCSKCARPSAVSSEAQMLLSRAQ